MPRIHEEKTVDASTLRAARRYELGLVQFGDRVVACIEIETTEGTTTYAMSLAAAVTFAGDLNAMLETDEGINALVRETLADARVMKRADALRTHEGPTHCSHYGNRIPGQCPHCPDAGEHIHPDAELPYVGEEG